MSPYAGYRGCFAADARAAPGAAPWWPRRCRGRRARRSTRRRWWPRLGPPRFPSPGRTIPGWRRSSLAGPTALNGPGGQQCGGLGTP